MQLTEFLSYRRLHQLCLQVKQLLLSVWFGRNIPVWLYARGSVLILVVIFENVHKHFHRDVQEQGVNSFIFQRCQPQLPLCKHSFQFLGIQPGPRTVFYRRSNHNLAITIQGSKHRLISAVSGDGSTRQPIQVLGELRVRVLPDRARAAVNNQFRLGHSRERAPPSRPAQRALRAHIADGVQHARVSGRLLLVPHAHRIRHGLLLPRQTIQELLPQATLSSARGT